MEFQGLNEALLRRCVCSECGGGPIELREDLHRREGLVTHPYLFCPSCNGKDYIAYSRGSTKQRRLAINQKSVFANKCAGGTHPSLQMLCAMMDLPLPVSSRAYQLHTHTVSEKSILQAKASMEQTRCEVRELYEVETGEMADILTWQKRGFTSLYGACFVIAHETGKVVDYTVMSKHCVGCRQWEKRDQTSHEYLTWKAIHVCTANYVGSSSGVEPHGTVQMFQRSSDYGIRYKYLISDGDSKSHSIIQESQPYGDACVVEKKDCIGHIHKRMGTALRNMVARHRGEKLADGKTIGGAGHLTLTLIDSLQNYYGNAIRRNVGSVEKMVKAVQATLLHVNSSDAAPRHHLCPAGEDSWCKYQVAQAHKESYHHDTEPIPEAIIQLLKPIYARLGSRELLEKCVDGYTQNANESLHAVVWKWCPKVQYLGKEAVEIACALAVCSWNDGLASFQAGRVARLKGT